MWRAWLTKYLLNIRYNTILVETLARSPGLRKVCGFVDDGPSETALSRFCSRLSKYHDLVEWCFTHVTEDMREYLADLGDDVAVDSTSVESYSNPNRKLKDENGKLVKDENGRSVKNISDPDAARGHKNSARTKPGKKDSKGNEKPEVFFCYKVHTISDANHEVPLGLIVTAANESDTNYLRDLMDKAKATYKDWWAPKHLIADKGYDAKKNHWHLVREEVVPVIHIRDMRSKKQKKEFSAIGEPICPGGKPMTYVKTNSEGKHYYKCSHQGYHPNKKKGDQLPLMGCQGYWLNPSKNWRVFGVLPRASKEWDDLYSKRMSIERIFKNTKQGRLLDNHLFRGLSKITLHATMSMLTYSATMLTRLRRGEEEPRRIRVKMA